MDARRCGQMMFTVAFSLFVAFATLQMDGVAHNLLALMLLLVLAGLILFVVQYRSTLCGLAVLCLRELAGLLCVPAVWRGRVMSAIVVCTPSHAFVRSFRFQLPPPILSF